MTRLREMVIDSTTAHNDKQKTQDKAMVFITFAVYLLTAGTLMEYVSVATLLKILGFMLCGQAFYFLWKSNHLAHH
ncbi:MAG: hypothetical protein KZQ64_09375 [gamma proteobacterium symbiont of Bathyaustriella thionipta]|nr:hypothetical protein [gamma proteobacterium symbiont of Bathyaustriella thionipta]MCU7951081.1 hypothetical protein [gamma proteobacterium symbiont of Bathyaustriella thionipta]MCU7953584.1 hypothetical protein [gamma proteobacterium symbiont of Bathyaustriella thionipta]MCU7957577.1 hypothetical protein [gamma proteobacterium symbiont of Bathyaustriella thionipta]MCU7966898.1 hypothetical protein [gamma proteobacterium symbiont of Bathyaustriella thionipta]